MGSSPGDVDQATSEGLENEQILIRQSFRRPFRRFTYVTAHSSIVPVSLHLHHRHFTYVAWRAAYAMVHPGGLVIILATGSEVRVFNPGRGGWIFSERKNPSEGK